MSTIVETSSRVTLLGGGESALRDLQIVLGFAPVLVAADGAAETALEAGRIPDAVIGDLDSLSDRVRAKVPPERIHHIPEQDTTDFDKCLRAITAPLVLGLGFLGGRLDHELAALSALLTRHEKRCILIGGVDLCFHAPPQIQLDLPLGTRLSLIPLCPVRGQSEGLEWPLGGDTFRPGGRHGASNRVTGPVHLSFDGPGMLVILPRQMLPAAIAALEGGAAPNWPDGARL